MTFDIGIPLPALMSQLLLGLVNGAFYAMLSLGLAVIFGLLNVINFAHGALFMLGAVLAWAGMEYAGLNYWVMLALSPLVVAVIGVVIEKSMLRWIYKLDHIYGLLLTLYAHIYEHDLKPRDRLALRLVEIEGMAYRDAADVLGCKLENFKMIVCRARKKIFASLVRVLGSRRP